MERPLIIDKKHTWLGKIPQDWKVFPLNTITHTVSIKNHPNEELLSLYRDYGVIIKSTRDDNHNRAGSDLSKYKLVCEGDLVINKMKAWQGSVGISQYRGIISPAYIICSVDKNFDSNYLNYLLRCNFYKHQYGRLSYGVRTNQWDIRYDDYKKLPVLIPEKQEQTTIANFLDYKTEKINRFINKKKQLIELLNEQKAAIINQAVTKGINPNVPMKDSGIEWLGKIPEHWELNKIKYLISKPIAGQWGQESKKDENDIICLRVADFDGLSTKENDLTIRNIEPKEEQILKLGDLLIEKSGGGEKTPVGRVVRFIHSFKAVTSNFVSKVSVNEDFVYSEYLLFAFKAINIVRWNVRSVKQTTGIQNLDSYDYFDNWIYYPKKDEQKSIINFINKESDKIDKTISTIEKEITLVEEYKTALIAEAVTGKIDVRNFKTPTQETPLAMVAEEAANYNKR
jgi:type I restriction enzyme S subunit